MTFLSDLGEKFIRFAFSGGEFLPANTGDDADVAVVTLGVGDIFLPVAHLRTEDHESVRGAWDMIGVATARGRGPFGDTVRRWWGNGRVTGV
jgi:hypothetical protein